MKVKLLFLLMILVSKIFAQQEQMQIELEEYLPPSPTAQEFIKYGEYPVSLYTGVPTFLSLCMR